VLQPCHNSMAATPKAMGNARRQTPLFTNWAADFTRRNGYWTFMVVKARVFATVKKFGNCSWSL
jgi:hypothetical protein